MSSTLDFGQVVVDATDVAGLAGFYSVLLDRPVQDGPNEFFALIPTSGTFPALMFLQVPEPRNGKNRLHLDFLSSDHTAEVERAVELGATRLGDYAEYGTSWTTLMDPEGNLFDIGAAH